MTIPATRLTPATSGHRAWSPVLMGSGAKHVSPQIMPGHAGYPLHIEHSIGRHLLPLRYGVGQDAKRPGQGEATPTCRVQIFQQGFHDATFTPTEISVKMNFSARRY